MSSTGFQATSPLTLTESMRTTPSLRLGVALERDRDAAGERVVLRRGVLLHELRELVDQGRAEVRHALVVAGREAHRELVGHQDAVARDDGRLRVELAAEGRGDLEGLQTALEGLGEGAVDDALQALLEVVENPQEVSSPAARRTLKRSGWNITMLVGQPPNAEGTAPQGDSGSLAELTAPAVLARVAELADALASGASARKGVGVQVPPRAPHQVRSRRRISVSTTKIARQTRPAMSSTTGTALRSATGW